MLGRSLLFLVRHKKSSTCIASTAVSKAAVGRAIGSVSSRTEISGRGASNNRDANIRIDNKNEFNNTFRRLKSTQASTRLHKKAIKVLLNNAQNNSEEGTTKATTTSDSSLSKLQEDVSLPSSNSIGSNNNVNKRSDDKEAGTDHKTILATNNKLNGSSGLVDEKKQHVNRSTTSINPLPRSSTAAAPETDPSPVIAPSAMPYHDLHEFAPKIVVIGVGGGGGNALNNMIAKGLSGVDFLALNTDAQHLATTLTDQRLQLGVELTRGLGCGANPEAGKKAAEESRDLIREQLEGSHIAFITAGMGGGTGTGAAPVIADICYQLGILTVGVVTMPFFFEGTRRTKLALQGIENMKSVCDTLITIPNQNLFQLVGHKTAFVDAFRIADDVLLGGVKSITDLMTTPGLINLDFADVQSVMVGMGNAILGTGVASSRDNSKEEHSDGGEGYNEPLSSVDGEYDDRAIRAAQLALDNPLLGTEWDIATAKGMLVNITGGRDMTLYEVDRAAQLITEKVHDANANIIFGSAFDERLEGSIRVSVVATGIDAKETAPQTPEGLENTSNISPKEDVGQRRPSRGFFGFSG